MTLLYICVLLVLLGDKISIKCNKNITTHTKKQINLMHNKINNITHRDTYSYVKTCKVLATGWRLK